MVFYYYYTGCFYDGGTCYIKAQSCEGYDEDIMRCLSNSNGLGLISLIYFEIKCGSLQLFLCSFLLISVFVFLFMKGVFGIRIYWSATQRNILVRNTRMKLGVIVISTELWEVWFHIFLCLLTNTYLFRLLLVNSKYRMRN
jgi:hypothetical protein